MSQVEEKRIVVHVDAGTLAFRAGQLIEKILWDRGIERAGKSRSSIVTPEDIQSCLDDDSLLEELRRRLNDERAEHESRNVA